MSQWTYGQIPHDPASPLRYFTPRQIRERITSVDLDELWSNGKRLILLDVDNTLVGWHSEDFDPAIVDWVQRARATGFKLCILSNTKRPLRLARIGEFLGVDTLRGRFKPSRQMYRAALAKYGTDAAATIMIGDQMMTDLLGARRSGIDAILVRPLATREFFGTKANRAIESIIRPFLFKMIEVTDQSTQTSSTALQQFLRFCVVGGISFVIDAALTTVLMNKISIGGHLISQTIGELLMGIMPWMHTPVNAAAPVLGGLASFIAMFNSFLLNRKWTFQAVGNHPTLTQVHRFYTIAISGAILNAVFFSLFLNMLGSRELLPAKIFATIIVAFWNFFGQRLYTFRPPKPENVT